VVPYSRGGTRLARLGAGTIPTYVALDGSPVGARSHHQALEQKALGIAEQVLASVEGCRQGLLPREGGAAPDGKQPAPLIDLECDLFGSHRLDFGEPRATRTGWNSLRRQSCRPPPRRIGSRGAHQYREPAARQTTPAHSASLVSGLTSGAVK
jgi:hypothetical protein